MITADTITDEQIRELRDDTWIATAALDFDDERCNAIIADCSLALATNHAARGRIAEILNAWNALASVDRETADGVVDGNGERR